MDRYKRNHSSISKKEQEIIKKTRVAIVGLGGLGGYVLENLVRLGVVNFHLIDNDFFEVSNLNRQILATEENLGKSKVDEAYKRAMKINSKAKIETFNLLLKEDSSHMLQGVDIVFDCLDSIKSRFELEKLCDNMNLLMIHGAIGGYYGQAAISSKNNRIMGKIYKEKKEVDESLGNLSITCMIVASIQVNLFLRFLLENEFKDELILVDVKRMIIDSINLNHI